MLKTQKSKVIEFRPRVAPTKGDAAKPLCSQEELLDYDENHNLLALVEAIMAEKNAEFKRRIRQGAQVPAGYIFDSVFGLMKVKEEAVAAI